MHYPVWVILAGTIPYGLSWRSKRTSGSRTPDRNGGHNILWCRINIRRDKCKGAGEGMRVKTGLKGLHGRTRPDKPRIAPVLSDRAEPEASKLLADCELRMTDTRWAGTTRNRRKGRSAWARSPGRLSVRAGLGCNAPPRAHPDAVNRLLCYYPRGLWRAWAPHAPRHVPAAGFAPRGYLSAVRPLATAAFERESCRRLGPPGRRRAVASMPAAVYDRKKIRRAGALRRTPAR